MIIIYVGFSRWLFYDTYFNWKNSSPVSMTKTIPSRTPRAATIMEYTKTDMTTAAIQYRWYNRINGMSF